MAQDDYGALAISALVLLLVLIVCYMCLSLYKLKTPGAECPEVLRGLGGGAAAMDRFWTPHLYRPSCSGSWLWQRGNDCRGLTTGHMPSIEADGVGQQYYTDFLQTCGGYLGVPP